MAPLQFLQPLVEKDEGGARRPALALHALHQETGPGRRLHRQGHGPAGQGTDEEKVPVAVAHIDGGEMGVLFQGLPQHGQGLQPGIQAGGRGQGMVHQQFDQGFQGAVEALQVVPGLAGGALEDVAGGGQDDAA